MSTPCGSLAWPVYGLEMLVASTASFQGRCHVSDVEGARHFIHTPHEEVGPDWLHALLRPAAVISSDGFALRRVTSYDLRIDPGATRLDLILTDWDRIPQSHKQSFYDFGSFAGTLARELGELQARDDHLCIERIISGRPGFTRPDLQDQFNPEKNYWAIQFTFELSDQ